MQSAEDKARKKRKRRKVKEDEDSSISRSPASEIAGNAAEIAQLDQDLSQLHEQQYVENLRRKQDEAIYYQAFLRPLHAKRLYTQVESESFIYPIIPTYPSPSTQQQQHLQTRFRFRGRWAPLILWLSNSTLILLGSEEAVVI